MTWSLGTATYLIIWWVLLFAVLPFGIQSQQELNSIVPGSDPGAPARPRLLMKLGVTTLTAALLWAVFDYFYLVYFVPR
jgi:predicted secreted protein